ncbi:holo-acyl-carrier-protein synthase [Ruminiclostridium papyrosolvens DSM 2782]|uniref:Holo-[acyl-carrier-protein] synthase n=1 Tax=Ruminiclostridium papyrosolvens DSM 2782 TaxID=588581 RepID=F1TCJ1_9FIRM|nr:holo-ACP synthase [Ruminiclostridium papyrosolvens]EGD47708.1 holo-acyl-carrier-protein synthase [Ruminiclostridium papyrosolvens DSM 2782]WES34426.1 holo-ACP synthase [Ruminiclostridium papyrosolvens DSM 2782]
MKLLLGTDIVEVDRVKQAIENGGVKFSEKVFTPDEIQYCESRNVVKYQSYAARFAAKEAVSKAFGTGIGKNAAFNEIEIIKDSLGKPNVRLTGKAKAFYDSMGASGISISLSHCREYAVAYATISIISNENKDT